MIPGCLIIRQNKKCLLKSVEMSVNNTDHKWTKLRMSRFSFAIDTPMVDDFAGVICSLAADQKRGTWASDKVCYDEHVPRTFVRLQECEYDYVEIKELSGKVLGKFCGSTTPGSVTSTSNVMRIEFRSDQTQSRKGFAAAFSAGRFLMTSTIMMTTMIRRWWERWRWQRRLWRWQRSSSPSGSRRGCWWWW